MNIVSSGLTNGDTVAHAINRPSHQPVGKTLIPGVNRRDKLSFDPNLDYSLRFNRDRFRIYGYCIFCALFQQHPLRGNRST